MGAGLPPPVDLLSVDAAVVVCLYLAVAAPKSHGILPVLELTCIVINLIAVVDSLGIVLCVEDCLRSPYTEEVHQSVGLHCWQFV